MRAAPTTPVTAGSPVELGRYETPEGGRVLLGRRIDGDVHVYDVPSNGQGRRHFVEAGFESKAELALLIADYRSQAERLGACPMSREGIDHAYAAPGAVPPPPELRTPTGVHSVGTGPAPGGTSHERKCNE